MPGRRSARAKAAVNYAEDGLGDVGDALPAAVKEEEEEEEEEEVEEENSDISGYHSDSDSTVMMSGNSPFISKTARYNFLSRSGNV